jgi:hypothetical protein
MFALIKTNSATEIAIYIPRDGADKSISSLVGMLEENAVFLKKSWGTLEIVKPKITIELGCQITEEAAHQTGEIAILVPESPCTLDDSFKIATPEVFVSNKKVVDKKDEEISRLRKELDFIKQQLEDAKHQLFSDSNEN